jgi:hypothetical protein
VVPGGAQGCAVCARTGGLLLERPQKLFGVFIAGRRGGANGTKRGHNLRLHGTLSVGQNAPRIRIGCCIPKVRVEPTEPVDRVGELIELPSHIHLQSAVPSGYPAPRRGGCLAQNIRLDGFVVQDVGRPLRAADLPGADHGAVAVDRDRDAETVAVRAVGGEQLRLDRRAARGRGRGLLGETNWNGPGCC